MRNVVLVAHGSRRQESNQEIAALAARIEKRLAPAGTRVQHAFLEAAEPSIDDALDVAATGGVREVVVVPYFLAPGNHVARDIPAAVARAAARAPHVRFRTLPYTGALPAMAELIAASIAAPVD